MRKSVAMTSELKNAPMVSEVIPAVNRILDNKKGFMSKLPTVAAGAKQTLGQKLISGGLGAAAVTAMPDTAIHMGINATRNAVARSAPGQKFMREGVSKGFESGMPGRGAELAWDHTVSPAALDTRRVGAAVASEGQKNPQALRRLAGTGLGTALRIPSVREQAQAHLPGLLARFGAGK